MQEAGDTGPHPRPRRFARWSAARRVRVSTGRDVSAPKPGPATTTAQQRGSAPLSTRDARHSRFPVIDGSQDDVIGFVHLRDLTIRPASDGARTVRELARDVKRLPASKRVLAALSEMRREGQHLVVVVDEFGGTAGIVTLEDLIEELVGEIHDEYDAAPEPPPDAGGPSEVD